MADEPVPPDDPPPDGFEPAGAVWNCSSRCWQEGGPHDETCTATILYRRTRDGRRG